MRVLQAPKSILTKAAGWMVLQPTTHALQVFIKEDRANLRNYPHPCSVDVRLPSWDMSPIVVVALLVNMARRERLTFQTWVNLGTARGIQVLSSLSKDARIYVHVVTDHVDRTIRAPNLVKRHAATLIKQVSARRRNWDEDDFAQACQQLSAFYPTTLRLWRACVRDRRG